MKILLLFFAFFIFSNVVSSQNLGVTLLESDSICYTFQTGDQVYIKKKGAWAYRKTVFYRIENDTVFFRNRALHIAEVAKIIPQKLPANLAFQTFTTGETFGTGLQVFAIIFGVGNAIISDNLDQAIWGYEVMFGTFLVGSCIKIAMGSLKNFVLSTSKYSARRYKYHFVQVP